MTRFSLNQVIDLCNLLKIRHKQIVITQAFWHWTLCTYYERCQFSNDNWLSACSIFHHFCPFLSPKQKHLQSIPDGCCCPGIKSIQMPAMEVLRLGASWSVWKQLLTLHFLLRLRWPRRLLTLWSAGTVALGYPGQHYVQRAEDTNYQPSLLHMVAGRRNRD